MKKQSNLSSDQNTQLKFTLSLTGLFGLFCLLAVGFVKLALEVRENETISIDNEILMYINGLSNSFLDAFIPVATDIGGAVGVMVLTLIFFLALAYRKEYTRALIIVVGVAGAMIINVILKSLFERQRPDLWIQLVHETGYSFPSGHAMASAALGLALVVALWNSRWRWWAVGFAFGYIIFVGFSRLYLGVHFPTDILAGWMVSGAWVLAVTLLIRSRFGHKALKNLG